MDSDSSDVILPSEIEMYVEDFQRSNLEELGSPKWLIYNGRFNKINQQAVIEASRLEEELVKDKLILHDKVPVIVHEVICASLWRQYVLPELLKIDPDPKHTFMAYTIIYHEAAAVALLEAILYHEESCESLGDSVIDLIEYCVEAVSYSISSKNVEQNTNTMDGKNFIQSEVHRLKFDAGIRSISILRCLAEFIDSLAVSAAKRLYEIHDLPLLFVELIENPPWILKSSDGWKIYRDGKWHRKCHIKHHEDGKLSKLEGQVWIGILFLLMGDKCHTHYEITDARKNRLLRLQRYLHEELLDQIAPLADLVQWLSRLAISSPPFNQSPIIFELVSEIREGLLKKYSNKWAKIAKKQAETYFNSSADVCEIAKSLSDAYDIPSCFESSTELMCANGCGSNGIRRCSRCKLEWYCGRECQVKHWVKHKIACNLTTA